jgi:hypothetical protein
MTYQLLKYNLKNIMMGVEGGRRRAEREREKKERENHFKFVQPTTFACTSGHISSPCE